MDDGSLAYQAACNRSPGAPVYQPHYMGSPPVRHSGFPDSPALMSLPMAGLQMMPQPQGHHLPLGPQDAPAVHHGYAGSRAGAASPRGAPPFAGGMSHFTSGGSPTRGQGAPGQQGVHPMQGAPGQQGMHPMPGGPGQQGMHPMQGGQGQQGVHPMHALQQGQGQAGSQAQAGGMGEGAPVPGGAGASAFDDVTPGGVGPAPRCTGPGARGAGEDAAEPPGLSGRGGGEAAHQGRTSSSPQRLVHPGEASGHQGWVPEAAGGGPGGNSGGPNPEAWFRYATRRLSSALYVCTVLYYKLTYITTQHLDVLYSLCVTQNSTGTAENRAFCMWGCVVVLRELLASGAARSW